MPGWKLFVSPPEDPDDPVDEEDVAEPPLPDADLPTLAPSELVFMVVVVDDPLVREIAGLVYPPGGGVAVTMAKA